MAYKIVFSISSGDSISFCRIAYEFVNLQWNQLRKTTNKNIILYGLRLIFPISSGDSNCFSVNLEWNKLRKTTNKSIILYGLRLIFSISSGDSISFCRTVACMELRFPVISLSVSLSGEVS